MFHLYILGCPLSFILSCPHPSYIYYAEGKERKGAHTQHPSVTVLSLDKLPPAIWEVLCCPGTYMQGHRACEECLGNTDKQLHR